MLLDLGLDPNSANNEGRTALMGAALKGRPEVDPAAGGPRREAGPPRPRQPRHAHPRRNRCRADVRQALDYAEGLVRVGVQSAVERPEAAALIRKLMTERGMEGPADEAHPAVDLRHASTLRSSRKVKLKLETMKSKVRSKEEGPAENPPAL